MEAMHSKIKCQINALINVLEAILFLTYDILSNTLYITKAVKC